MDKQYITQLSTDQNITFVFKLLILLSLNKYIYQSKLFEKSQTIVDFTCILDKVQLVFRLNSSKVQKVKVNFFTFLFNEVFSLHNCSQIFWIWPLVCTFLLCHSSRRGTVAIAGYSIIIIKLWMMNENVKPCLPCQQTYHSSPFNASASWKYYLSVKFWSFK